MFQRMQYVHLWKSHAKSQEQQFLDEPNCSQKTCAYTDRKSLSRMHAAKNAT